MKVSGGMRGRILLVWQNINSPFFTDEEKGEALRYMLDMLSHNSVSKDLILTWCDWLWHKVFEEVKE